jgi:heme-degrading monooxygenase HmoA
MSVEIPKCHYLPLGEWESILSSSPLVEMLSFSSIPSSLPPSTFSPLVSYIKSTAGCVDVVAAPTMQYGDAEGDGRFLLMVGWESLEAHEKGKNPEGFKKLSTKLWKKVEMHHVRWEKVVPLVEGKKARL